jgi:hypothetical protein
MNSTEVALQYACHQCAYRRAPRAAVAGVHGRRGSKLGVFKPIGVLGTMLLLHTAEFKTDTNERLNVHTYWCLAMLLRNAGGGMFSWSFLTCALFRVCTRYEACGFRAAPTQYSEVKISPSAAPLCLQLKPWSFENFCVPNQQQVSLNLHAPSQPLQPNYNTISAPLGDGERNKTSQKERGGSLLCSCELHAGQPCAAMPALIVHIICSCTPAP